jgi:hypothetical protein
LSGGRIISGSVFGVLNKEKALLSANQRMAAGFIISIPLQEQAVDGMKIIDPCCCRNKAFSL